MKLGKREPTHKPTLMVGEFLRAHELEIPVHPPTSPPPMPVGGWTMDRNDEAGVCVVAGVDHTLQAIAENLGLPRQPWTDQEILELYRTQNPDFTGWDKSDTDADQGMDVQTFLEECVRRGHILAFAKLDHENRELMRAATFLGGGVVTGETLREAHEDMTLWDVSKTPIWGGHCTTTVGYGENFSCVTWGQLVPYTEGFAERHMDEAWFVLTQALVNSPGFRNHFDMAGFADAVSDLTGGKVIVPVPPQPVPAPPSAPPGDNPPPVPGDPAWEDFPFAAVDAWANHPVHKSDTHYETKAKLAYKQWKANHRVDERNATTRRVVYDAQGNRIGEIELGSGSFWASQS